MRWRINRRKNGAAAIGLSTLMVAALAINMVSLVVAAIVLVNGWSRAEWLVQRGTMTHQQLEILASVSGAIDRYLDLVERSAPPGDVAAGEREVTRILDRWSSSVARESQMLDAPASAQEARAERARIARIRALVARGEQALLTRREPLWVTRTEIEVLIQEAIADERAEVEQTTAAIARTGRQIGVLVIGIPLAALGVAGLMSLLLARTMRRRLRALMAGASAIGGGDLAYRFEGNARDDLGLLAVMFNRMAARLRRSRSRLEVLQHELEARVAHRTAELEQKNRQLQAIDSNREQFFSEISHELRTPLTALRGEAEVSLRQPNDAGGQRESLRHIVALAGDLENSINDLVELARSQTRELLFVREHIDLVSLLARTASAGRALGIPRSVAVLFVDNVVRSDFRGDAQRLQQTFLTLVDNAIKHAPAGSSVTVTLDASPAAGMYHVSVVDRGPGIPQAIRNRVFDDFFQGDPSQRGGMGLGLAIARRVIQAHGGRIEITDADHGSGTRVRVSLPLYEARRAAG